MGLQLKINGTHVPFCPHIQWVSQFSVQANDIWLVSLICQKMCKGEPLLLTLKWKMSTSVKETVVSGEAFFCWNVFSCSSVPVAGWEVKAGILESKGNTVFSGVSFMQKPNTVLENPHAHPRSACTAPAEMSPAHCRAATPFWLTVFYCQSGSWIHWTHLYQRPTRAAKTSI